MPWDGKNWKILNNFQPDRLLKRKLIENMSLRYKFYESLNSLWKQHVLHHNYYWYFTVVMPSLKFLILTRAEQKHRIRWTYFKEIREPINRFSKLNCILSFENYLYEWISKTGIIQYNCIKLMCISIAFNPSGNIRNRTSVFELKM